MMYFKKQFPCRKLVVILRPLLKGNKVSLEIKNADSEQKRRIDTHILMCACAHTHRERQRQSQ